MHQNVENVKNRLLLDTKCYQSRPDENEFGHRITKQTTNIDIVELSIQLTKPKGKSWVPAYLELKRKKNCWKSQSIFVLDFNNKDSETGLQVENPISFEQVLDRLKNFGLNCSFAYTTFSHQETWNRFQVVFQLNQTIIDKKYQVFIQEALRSIFPESDESCIDATRIILGGNEIIYTNYQYYLNLDLLYLTFEFSSIKHSSGSNMKRDMERFKKKNGSNFGNPYSKYIETTENASNIDKVDWVELTNNIRILSDFKNPDIKLTDHQLFGLATNMRCLERGEEKYKEYLMYPDYNYMENIIRFQYCKTSQFAPMRLEDFSPYKEDWGYINLLNAARKKQLIRLQKNKTITIKQTRQELKETFNNVLLSDDKYIHIFKVATAAGKTELCTDQKNIVLALPNHFLKTEISKQRMRIDHKTTPDYEELSKEIKNYLEYYYTIGAYSKASKFLAENSETNEQVRKYYEQCNECYQSADTVLTTHQKALFVTWKHNTIIFDEDIISSLLSTDKVSLRDLNRLYTKIENVNDKAYLKTLIDNITDGRVYFPIASNFKFANFKAIEHEILNSKKYESKILQFFRSKYYVVDKQDVNTIHFINKFDIPQNKKIIIFSATADESIYRTLFGDRVKFYDVSNVKPTGLIVQDTKYSYSRSSLRNPKHRQYVVDILKQSQVPTITFAGCKELLNEHGVNVVEEMHFGKTTGSNILKGQNIAVVGAPHANPITIALYSKLLNFPVTELDFKVYQQMVEHNGFRFWFNAYENKHLRKLQFMFIETELIQAVGRARVNTELCKVQVFSGYPLPEACITEEEKKLGLQDFEYSNEDEVA
jgi:hypothetical protein